MASLRNFRALTWGVRTFIGWFYAQVLRDDDSLLAFLRLFFQNLIHDMPIFTCRVVGYHIIIVKPTILPPHNPLYFVVVCGRDCGPWPHLQALVHFQGHDCITLLIIHLLVL